MNNDLVEYVNPFIGTGKFPGVSKWGAYGGTYPGAVIPFGMVQFTPETRIAGEPKGYYFEDSRIYCFSLVDHKSGYPNGSSGNIRIMPNCDASEGELLDGFSFSHQNETALPGYYAVYSENKKLQAELTATTHIGFARFTYRECAKPRIVLYDLANLRVTGVRSLQSRYKGYFVHFECNLPFRARITSHHAWELSFSEKQSTLRQILVKISVSRVGFNGAIENLAAEIPHWDFEKMRNNARDIWNRQLKRIEITGGTKNQRTIFYTALYHSLLFPNGISDADGRYMGQDLKVHKSSGTGAYANFSPWDTFRCLHPLLTLIAPNRQRDMIVSLLNVYHQTGRLPTGPMTGNHTIPIIVDSFFKGITDFDSDDAYQAMRKSVMELPYSRDDFSKYVQLNYVSAEFPESVTRTLEYAYDDWALAEFAGALGKTNDERILKERALSYRNVFNPKKQFMTPRSQDGSWRELGGYKEGDKWTYSWFVPHNVQDLINLMAGPEHFNKQLERAFSGGHYVHDNEPPLHYAYLFNYTGAPWITQHWVQELMQTYYTNDAGGIPGNDDLGSMSSWYVWSAMGIYPTCPGKPIYDIGSPIFERVTIHLNNGHDFVVSASNISTKNIYIQSVDWNGAEYTKSHLYHSMILGGGQLIIQMGAQPNKHWANRSESIAPSMTTASPKFILTDSKLSLQSAIANQVITFSCRLKNDGALGIKNIELFVDEKHEKSAWVMLMEGESREVVLPFRLYQIGLHNITVNNVRVGEVKVTNPRHDSTTQFEILALKMDPLVKLGRPVVAEITVKNIGGIIGLAKPELSIDGKKYIADKPLKLEPGKVGRTRLPLSISDLGVHTVSVKNLPLQKIKVYQTPRESLVLAFDFEEGKGKTAHDKSGFASDGIIDGNVTWTEGRFGKALKMGRSGYINVPRELSLDISGNTITIMTWLFPVDEALADFISKGDHIVLKMQNPTTLNFFAGGWGRGECQAPVPDNWNNHWHHIAGVCDGESLRLYIDGDLKEKVAIAGEIGCSSFPWNIGRNAEIPIGRSTNGMFDDVRIYRESLSQEEIREVMNGNNHLK